MNLVWLWRRRLISSSSEPAHGHGCSSGSVRSPLPPPASLAPHPCAATHARGHRLFATAAPPPGRLTARRGGNRGRPGGAQGRGGDVQAALLRGARLRRRALPRSRIGRRQHTPRDRVPVSFICTLLHTPSYIPHSLSSFLSTLSPLAVSWLLLNWNVRYQKGLCQAAFLLTRYYSTTPTYHTLCMSLTTTS
jgi:hypothetical protein